MAEKVEAKECTPPPKPLRYDEESERNKIDLYLISGKTQRVMVGNQRVRVHTLENLCKQYDSKAEQVGNVAVRGSEAELQTYTKKVERLRRANNIQKNWALFFARNSSNKLLSFKQKCCLLQKILFSIRISMSTSCFT